VKGEIHTTSDSRDDTSHDGGIAESRDQRNSNQRNSNHGGKGLKVDKVLGRVVGFAGWIVLGITHARLAHGHAQRVPKAPPGSSLTRRPEPKKRSGAVPGST